MPHPDAEHGLQIQLATALRERDEAREEATRMGEACIAWGARVDELDAALAAANARAEKAEAGWRQAGYDYMRLKEAASVKDTEAAKWIALRDEQFNRAIAAEQALAAARRDLTRWPAVVREYVEHVGAAMPNEGDRGCAECDALLGLLAAPAAGDSK